MKDLSQHLATLDKAAPAERELVLAKMLAIAWSQGYDTCYDDGGEDLNPYRDDAEKAARASMGKA